MNGKKAKEMRKFLRAIGHNPEQRQYDGSARDPVLMRFRREDDGTIVPDEMGIHIMKVQKGVPIRLDGNCGRAIYQELKRRAS